MCHTVATEENAILITKPAPRKPLKPLIRALDVVERDAKWLWYPYIPAGSSTMLFGPGGVGKSHIAVDIAARVSSGRSFPEQLGPPPVPQNVLILAAEDDIEVVLRPRLRRAGADMSRVFFPPEFFILDTRGILDMESYIQQAAATVVFIDPVVAYMGGKTDMNKMNEVRTFTGPIQRLAQQTGSAIILVHHSKKSREGTVADFAAGSTDFTNGVRSSLFATRTNDGSKIVYHAKSNYSKEGDSLRFSIDDHTGVVWEGTEERGEGIDGPGDGDDTSPRGRPPKADSAAAAFIKDMLAAGPLPARMIEERARDEKLAWRTVNRAKNGIAESYIERTDGKLVWFWKLI